MSGRTEARDSHSDRERRDSRDYTPVRARAGPRSRLPAEREQDRRREDCRDRDRPQSPWSHGRHRPEPARGGRHVSCSTPEARQPWLVLRDRGRDSPRSWREERGRRTDSPLAERNHSWQPERRSASKSAAWDRLRPDAPDRASDRRRGSASPSGSLHPPPAGAAARRRQQSLAAGAVPAPCRPGSRKRGRGSGTPLPGAQPPRCLSAAIASSRDRRRGSGQMRLTKPATAGAAQPALQFCTTGRDCCGGLSRKQLHGRLSTSLALPPLSPQPPQQPPPPSQPSPQQSPALDFFSEAFDALLALRTPGLQPPNAGVRSLQMFQQCRFILPPELPESLADAKFQRRSQEDRESAAARSGPAARRRQAAELKHPVVDRIASSVTKGPLLLLRACFEAGGRVRVVTRHARGVRGWAEGSLMAFDKHMNLVLSDVEESYTVRLRIERTTKQLRLRQPAPAGSAEQSQAHGAGMPAAQATGSPQPQGDESEGGGYEVVERTRTAFKQERRSRRLRQVFVRGSNVVLISVVQQPAVALGVEAVAKPSRPGPARAD